MKAVFFIQPLHGISEKGVIAQMANVIRKEGQTEPKVKPEEHDEKPLKGTFVSVMLLGAFLALTWLLVFILFIARG